MPPEWVCSPLTACVLLPDPGSIVCTGSTCTGWIGEASTQDQMSHTWTPILCGTELSSQRPQDSSLMIMRQLSLSQSTVLVILIKLEHLWCLLQWRRISHHSLNSLEISTLHLCLGALQKQQTCACLTTQNCFLSCLAMPLNCFHPGVSNGSDVHLVMWQVCVQDR